LVFCDRGVTATSAFREMIVNVVTRGVTVLTGGESDRLDGRPLQQMVNNSLQWSQSKPWRVEQTLPVSREGQLQTTIEVPLSDQVLELISELRAARDAGRQASPVAQREPENRDARPWQPLLLAIGLLSAGALATDLLYPYVSRPTPFSKPTFAVFASVALAGRLAGARGAWFAVLFTWPAEVLLGRTTVDLHEFVHIGGTLTSAAVVAACFTPWVWWPEPPWAALRRAWDRALRSFGLRRLRRWRLWWPGEQPAAGLCENP
jgi:hypothetical protein